RFRRTVDSLRPRPFRLVKRASIRRVARPLIPVTRALAPQAVIVSVGTTQLTAKCEAGFEGLGRRRYVGAASLTAPPVLALSFSSQEGGAFWGPHASSFEAGTASFRKPLSVMPAEAIDELRLGTFGRIREAIGPISAIIPLTAQAGKFDASSAIVVADTVS